MSPADIARLILSFRGHKVMLDSDLARLYGVTAANFNKAAKRNINRFPKDFVFQLTAQEADVLRFQYGISKTKGRGGRPYLPFVFTEQGVAMLASVLRSRRAVAVSNEIMGTFVRRILDPVNGLNGAKRLNYWNGWNGLEKKSTIDPSYLRCHSPADGAATA